MPLNAFHACVEERKSTLLVAWQALGIAVPGDLILARPGPAQHHLLVASGPDRFIHAHAGLRRVVAMPGPLPWPVLHRWRFAPTTLEG